MKGSSYSSTWICALALVFAAGCGGGQGGASAAQSVHTSKSGNAVFTYFGNPKPMATTSTGAVSVVGQAGATFSYVRLEPPPSLNDTYLAYARAISGSTGSGGQLYTSPYKNISAQKLLYDDDGSNIVPGISAYGTIAFTTAETTLFSIRPDGTGLTQIKFTGIPAPIGGRYSRDGTNRMAFVTGTDVYIGPGIGGSASLVQTNVGNGGLATWSPAGTELAYSVSVGTSGYQDAFTTPTGGGTAVDVTPTALQNTGTIYPLAWSPDGVTILAVYAPANNSTRELVTFPINNPAVYTVITPSGDTDVIGDLSPDGSMIAFQRTNANGAAPGLYICDAAGLFQTLVLPQPQGSLDDLGVAWSPFLPNEYVVSASTSVYSTFYKQAASGFLLSQNGDQFGSFVAFTANTPADAAIQSPTSPSTGASLIYTLTADSITSIGYINSYFSPGTTISLTSTPTVIVTVDGVTGQVDLVAPAAAAKPALSKNADGTYTYKAKFSAVYDGTGKNLAPNGASHIVVNPATGKLLSFR